MSHTVNLLTYRLDQVEKKSLLAIDKFNNDFKKSDRKEEFTKKISEALADLLKIKKDLIHFRNTIHNTANYTRRTFNYRETQSINSHHKNAENFEKKLAAKALKVLSVAQEAIRSKEASTLVKSSTIANFNISNLTNKKGRNRISTVKSLEEIFQLVEWMCDGIPLNDLKAAEEYVTEIATVDTYQPVLNHQPITPIVILIKIAFILAYTASFIHIRDE